MGLDVHGQIIVGEKRCLKKTKIKVTKYNENTGEPFQTTQDKEDWLTEDGLDLECYTHERHISHYSNYEENFDIIGIIVSCTNLRSSDETEHYQEISIESIENAKQDYKRITGREPKVYNFLSYSY